jgi:hypothetical protein
MDSAQRLYIESIIGESCMTELCAALDASELDPGDPGYAALTANQETFLNKIEPVVITATELLFFQKFGMSKITAKGAQYQENWLSSYHKYQYDTIESVLDSEIAYFQKWYDENCGFLDCYVCPDTDSTCEDDDITADILWTTTSPYSF